jgi:hypothetical protein
VPGFDRIHHQPTREEGVHREEEFPKGAAWLHQYRSDQAGNPEDCAEAGVVQHAIRTDVPGNAAAQQRTVPGDLGQNQHTCAVLAVEGGDHSHPVMEGNAVPRALRETEFTRSIESFAPDTPALLAEFDSSLGGSGVILFAQSDGAELVIGVSAIDLDFLGFKVDSSNQNLSEFLGAIIAVIAIIPIVR